MVHRCALAVVAILAVGACGSDGEAEADGTTSSAAVEMATTTLGEETTTTVKPPSRAAIDAISLVVSAAQEWNARPNGPDAATVASTLMTRLGGVRSALESASDLPQSVRTEAAEAVAELEARIYADFECIRIELGYGGNQDMCDLGASMPSASDLARAVVGALAPHTGVPASGWTEDL